MTYFKSKNDSQPKTVSVHENQFMIIRPGVKHIQCIQNQAHMMVLELRYEDSNLPADLYISNSGFVSLIPGAKHVLQKLDCVSIFTDIQDVKRIFGKLLTLQAHARDIKNISNFGSSVNTLWQNFTCKIYPFPLHNPPK